MIGTPEFFPAGPTEIIDGTLARAKAAAGVVNAWKQRPLPVKDEDVPFVLVWHGGDRTEPWGDANVGAPTFDHTLKLIVVVAVTAETPNGLDLLVTATTERVRTALLTDPSWIGLFEACHKADVGYAFPGDGQIPYARGLIEFEVTFRSEWAPADPADFRGMTLTVGTDEKTSFTTSIDIPEPKP
jgi:hypothetical protein